jgi:hypothetical protein
MSLAGLGERGGRLVRLVSGFGTDGGGNGGVAGRWFGIERKEKASGRCAAKFSVFRRRGVVSLGEKGSGKREMRSAAALAREERERGSQSLPQLKRERESGGTRLDSHSSQDFCSIHPLLHTKKGEGRRGQHRIQ